jgi:hypothetical protein
MLSSTALVSLACLLSTGEMDSNKLTQNLSQQELVQIQEIVDSGVCLPDNFNKLIVREDGVGKAGVTARAGSPTGDY